MSAGGFDSVSDAASFRLLTKSWAVQRRQKAARVEHSLGQEMMVAAG